MAGANGGGAAPTVVVEDLPTARRILPELPRGFSAVTLGGEIARSGGSVTGGSAVRESGVLGRERELRELPGDIAALAARRDEATRGRDEARGRLTAIDEERAALEGLVGEVRGAIEAGSV